MYGFIHKELNFAHKLDERTLPSDEYQEHAHNFYELYYFLRGTVEYTVEKNKRKIESGDIILISPGDHHYATVSPDVPYERYVFKFPMDCIPEHLREALGQKTLFYLGTDSIKSYFEKTDDFFYAYCGDADNLSALLRAMLNVILITMYVNAPSPQLEQASSITSKIIDYVNTHICEPLDLKLLSQEFNYSQSYLSVEFKRDMKVSLMQYIRNRKIFAARNMIMSGHKPTHVASYLGFDEYSTFYRAYAKIIGVAPSKK